MTIDSDYEFRKIPVTSSKSLYIPPYSTRSTKVTIPVGFVCTSLIPNKNLRNSNSLFITHTLLDFRNHCSIISLCNTSSFPRYIQKGYCVGFLSYHTITSSIPGIFTPLQKSDCATSFFGGLTASSDLHACDRISNPTYHSVPSSLMNRINSLDFHRISFGNTIQTSTPSFDNYIQSLVKTIENKQFRDRLYSLLSRFSQSFNISEHNIAKTSIHHVINTIPHSLLACKPYSQPDKEQAMCKIIREFLQAGLISESYSPYAAPAILIKKKDESYRFVVDYKRLNSVTIKDSSSLPNMENAIRKLGQGYNYFFKLDLKSGFYQIPIGEADKEKTAFVTPCDLYQFNVLPMDLKNAAPTFQRVMNDTLKFCRKFSLVYLDDIIVYSKSFEERLYHLERVLIALQSKNLILNPPRCVFASNKIDYLEHTISEKSITPIKEKSKQFLQLRNHVHLLRQINL